MSNHDEPYFPDEPEPASRHRLRWKYILLIIAGLPFFLSVIYIVIQPVSMLMLSYWLTLNTATRTWIPLEAITPQVVRAVIASEDSRFCSHSGVDWQEMQSLFKMGSGPSRGASTLSMQTAKNLFLWQNPAFIRKPVEIVLAHWLELLMPKRRILEIYLNIAEWGTDGTFGIEAGAQRAFKRSASALSLGQAALMAAALPNPLMRLPAKPSRSLARHAAIIMARMEMVDVKCIFR
jgi:monofunctional biosynthetic peptidoglycan transglycosylase